MNSRKFVYGKIFTVVSFAAALFVFAEIVMQAFGKSICLTDGCKLAAQTVRFNEIVVLAAGMLMFVSLGVLSAVGVRVNKTNYDRLLNGLIIIALACEGFFMGYLAFRLYTICLFCVVVFSFVVILGTLRLLAHHYEVIAGFGAFAAIFVLLYVVLPVGISPKLPEQGRLILFYSANCKYCDAIKAEFAKKRIPVSYVEARTYGAFLSGLGIDQVPTLVVNDHYQKAIFTGQEAIMRYLNACLEEDRAAQRPKSKQGVGRAATSEQVLPSGMKLHDFSAENLFSHSQPTASGNGLCRQDEICK